MPRKSSITSVAEEHAAPGGAAAVDRALSVLSAFRTGDVSLSVTELADRTRLYKSTVLRLLASLAHGGMLREFYAAAKPKLRDWSIDQMWIGLPVTAMAASFTASLWVGCAWQV